MQPSAKPSRGETLLFPCAGAAHCGRVAYETALQLTGDGLGQVFCLAAVAANVGDKVDRAREAAMRVAIDGCDDHCARKTLERAGLHVDVHLVLTEHGIDRSPVCASVVADARRINGLAREALDTASV